MKDDIGVADQPRQQLAVADVALDQSDSWVEQRRSEIVAPAALEIVDRDNAGAILLKQEIDDVGADKARTAGHQDVLPGQICQVSYLS